MYEVETDHHNNTRTVRFKRFRKKCLSNNHRLLRRFQLLMFVSGMFLYSVYTSYLLRLFELSMLLCLLFKRETQCRLSSIKNESVTYTLSVFCYYVVC